MEALLARFKFLTYSQSIVSEFSSVSKSHDIVLIIVRQALHHPFTAPHPDDMGDLRTARALAYDLVYNGVEVCFTLLASRHLRRFACGARELRCDTPRPAH